MTEQDVHNFSSSSSPHRLPTLSATQALKNLSSTPRKPISTRLKGLDSILQGREYDASSQYDLPSGISRGEVTEVCGPPGVGKTTFALQVAATAMRSGGSVVWVDTSYILNGSRLKECLSEADSNETTSTEVDAADKFLDNFHHFTAPTLPHLLALLTHPSNSFPPPNASLLVIDEISTLFSLAFPKSGEKVSDQQTPAKKTQAAQWASGRRWGVMESLISDLGKLAVTKNIAIVMISQMTTRIRDEARAMLYPAIAGHAWESGVATRITLFRDWLLKTSEGSSQGEHQQGVRFARVTKAKNMSYESIGRLATFQISQHGLEEIRIDETEIRAHTSPNLPASSLKRRRAIADSESEDGDAASDQEFGWDGDEATLEAEGLVE